MNDFIKLIKCYIKHRTLPLSEVTVYKMKKKLSILCDRVLLYHVHKEIKRLNTKNTINSVKTEIHKKQNFKMMIHKWVRDKEMFNIFNYKEN